MKLEIEQKVAANPGWEASTSNLFLGMNSAYAEENTVNTRNGNSGT